MADLKARPEFWHPTRVKGKTLTLLLRPDDKICTTPTWLYEVTVTFARPIISGSRVKKVVARYGSARQPMRLVTIVYG